MVTFKVGSFSSTKFTTSTSRCRKSAASPTRSNLPIIVIPVWAGPAASSKPAKIGCASLEILEIVAAFFRLRADSRSSMTVAGIRNSSQIIRAIEGTLISMDRFSMPRSKIASAASNMTSASAITALAAPISSTPTARNSLCGRNCAPLTRNTSPL